MSKVKNEKFQFNIRVRDENEYKAIKDKAKADNLSVSDFLRRAALNSKIKVINNGNEIVEEMRSIHNDMITYNNRMSKNLSDLSKAIEENTKLLKEHPISKTEEFRDTYKIQRYRIKTLIDMIAYQNEGKANEISMFVDYMMREF